MSLSFWSLVGPKTQIADCCHSVRTYQGNVAYIVIDGHDEIRAVQTKRLPGRKSEDPREMFLTESADRRRATIRTFSN